MSDRLPKGWQGLPVRRNKYGGSENSSIRLRELRTDSLLAEEGVLVRRALVSHLEKIGAQIERGKMEHVTHFAIIGGDIRKLKEVNDPKYKGSHKLGDLVILNAGKFFASVMRIARGDILSRVGGDEFLGIMPVHEGDEIDRDDPGKVFQERIVMIEKGVKNGLGEISKDQECLRDNERGSLDMAMKVVTREEMLDLILRKRDDGGDIVTTLQEFFSEELSKKKSVN